jgi:hypothetical protein
VKVPGAEMKAPSRSDPGRTPTHKQTPAEGDSVLLAGVAPFGHVLGDLRRRTVFSWCSYTRVRNARRAWEFREVDVAERNTSEAISRRRALFMALAAPLSLAMPPTVLLVSDAETAQPAGPETAQPAAPKAAQQVAQQTAAPPAAPQTAPQAGPQTGTERRQERRKTRAERRQERRTARVERRQKRRTARTERRQERRAGRMERREERRTGRAQRRELRTGGEEKKY